MKNLTITLSNPREEGTEKFSNLVDPVLLSIFIERIQDADDKRSIEELVEALLEGRF
ncbi:hypothetical protein N8Z24_00715 [bacterium]|nr:hypothetical protein [bacterium]